MSSSAQTILSGLPHPAHALIAGSQEALPINKTFIFVSFSAGFNFSSAVQSLTISTVKLLKSSLCHKWFPGY